MDIERTLEFVVAQQAKFASDINKLEQQQEQITNILLNLPNHQERTVTIMEKLAEKLSETVAQISTLADRQLVTEQIVIAVTEQMSALISNVEQHISNHQ
jgi:hypothetical protein